MLNAAEEDLLRHFQRRKEMKKILFVCHGKI